MLDKAGLTSALTSVFTDLSNKTAAAKAAEMADAIDQYVKTAQVTVSTTCAAGGGPGTGTLL